MVVARPRLLGAAARRLIAVMAVWWIASRETQVAQYRVLGTVSAIELDVGTADVEIVGGASTAVEVRRTAEFAFGRPPDQTRRLDGDVLQITSRCPDTVVGTCHAAYRIGVRDNVQVNVRDHAAAACASPRSTARRGSRPARARSPSTASAASSSAPPRRPATSAAPPPARPTGWSCAPAAATSTPIVPGEPLPRRRQQRARQRRGAQPDRDRRRPVRRPGHQRHRRRARGGARMTAIRASRGLELPRHLRAAGRTLLYLLLGLPYGVTYLVRGRRRAAARRRAQHRLDRAAAAGGRDAARLAARGGRAAHRPTGWLDAHLPPVPRAPRGDWRQRAGGDRAPAVLARAGDAAAQAAGRARGADRGRRAGRARRDHARARRRRLRRRAATATSARGRSARASRSR